MFLITTAEQSYWKTDEPVLFLGDWCKLFADRDIWKNSPHEVLLYHWDDRNKLYNDYISLDGLYERVLPELAIQLNDIHHVDHSKRYWRIVIGPWLYWFIQILYDRYQSIQSAAESGKVTNTFITDGDDERWLPQTFPGLIKHATESDGYNHFLYSNIIKFIDKIPYEIVSGKEITDSERIPYLKRNIFSLKETIKKIIEFYEKNLPASLNRVVFVSSYLSKVDLIKLQLSLGQLPCPVSPVVIEPESKINTDARKMLGLKSPVSDFEKILDGMMRKQIPLIYLESYQQMNERALKAYPRKPTVIFTENACYANEAFKFWAGYNVDCGSKLIGIQHGGHYGTGRWSSMEKHETVINDSYFTWGWKSGNCRRIKPVAAAQLNSSKRQRHLAKKNGRILMVLTTVPRYSHQMYSIPVAASSMLSYFDDQYRFVRALSKSNQRKLLVRLYHADYGWQQMARWHSELPQIECYLGDKSMLQQMNESSLFICTYNATTFLETFVADFPTIIFWNPDHWEIRQTAQPYFDELQQVGILHYTPESAASLANAISSDPIHWWKQPGVQKAKDDFCEQFAKTSDAWLDEWKAELAGSLS